MTADHGRTAAPEQFPAGLNLIRLGSQPPEMYRDTVASATRNFPVGAG